MEEFNKEAALVEWSRLLELVQIRGVSIGADGIPHTEYDEQISTLELQTQANGLEFVYNHDSGSYSLKETQRQCKKCGQYHPIGEGGWYYPYCPLDPNKVYVCEHKHNPYHKLNPLTVGHPYPEICSVCRNAYYFGVVPDKHFCAICRMREDVLRLGGTLFVDHDHKTGCIRRLLCSPCNSRLALIENGPPTSRTQSKPWYKAALHYLATS